MIIPSDITIKYPFIEMRRTRGIITFYYTDLSGGNEALYTIDLKTEKECTELKVQRHSYRATGQWFYKTIFDGEINNPQDLKKILELTKVI